jgi:hypothetical protein
MPLILGGAALHRCDNHIIFIQGVSGIASDLGIASAMPSANAYPPL